MVGGDFVSVGSALPQCEDDELKSRKPVAVHEQVVRDDKGRIRFHGAFTGGFSAGYFNSVDTQEGWAPKQFKSTRDSRDKYAARRPEDYMDEEDFGEFGIAPKKLSTNNKYQSGSKRSWQSPQDDPFLSLFSNPHLARCLEPSKVTVGHKLLKRLGWRTVTMDTSEDSDEEVRYGCSLPPELMARRAKKSAPKIQPETTCPIDFSFQINRFGLGYKGLAPSSTKPVNKPKSKFHGIQGQAFGVGAFEDDDDDIYGRDAHLYKTYVGEDEEEIVKSPIRKPIKRKDKDGIDGFVRSSCKPVKVETYPPPEIPSNYKPVRKTLETKITQKSEDDLVTNKKPGYQKPMDCFKRWEILGEKREFGSVFDLMSEKSKMKMEDFQRKIESSKSDEQLNDKSHSHITPTEEDSKTSSQIIKPFNDAKVAETNKEGMTEWEKELKDKTIHFTNLLRKKFVSAGDVTHEEKEPSDKEKAVSKNMFGRLTRETETWHPAKLMCVRFNIEDPYPDSTVEGLPTQKHSKLSIFDLLVQGGLNVAEEKSHSSVTLPTQSTKTRPEQQIPASKPLAILASVDLRRPTAEAPSLNLIQADDDDETEEDVKQKPQELQSVKDERDEAPKAPAPTIDIFKAIFEDDDSDDEDEEEDERSDKNVPQQPVANATPEKVMTKIEPMDMKPDIIIYEDSPIAESRTDSEHKKHKKYDKEKYKHKKDKHKKDKHKHKKDKHKSEKSKKSKKERRKNTSDDSD